MAQVIDTAISTPTTVTSDAIVITENGSLSSDVADTPALSVTGANSSVYVDGGVYGSGTVGINVGSIGASMLFVISDTGRVVSSAAAGNADGSAITSSGQYDIYNNGLISGTTYGIQTFDSKSSLDYNTGINNTGTIQGGLAALFFNTTDIYILENQPGALVQGITYGIYSPQYSSIVVYNYAGATISGQYFGDNSTGKGILTQGQLSLHNYGTILGGISAGSTSTVAKDSGNSKATEGSKIINTGEILANADHKAIELGIGADVVKNKGGIIDGDIRLGAGGDKFIGGSGDESVFGGKGGDTIKTGGGDDFIAAGKGKDLVDPGTGDDFVKLGKGKDVLVFAADYDKDKVGGFDPGKDKVDLSDLGYSSFKDLKHDLTGHSHKVVLHVSDTDVLILKGVKLSDLSHHDFIL